MKWLLGFSLLLNGFLGWKIFQKEELPPIESTIVEAHPRVITREVRVEVPAEKVKEVMVENKQPAPFDERVADELVQKVDTDREDYLTQELALNPSKISEIKKIKNKYMKFYSEVIPDGQLGQITVDQKRRLIELEEARDKEFAGAMGEAKWERFIKFREEYNRKMQKQSNESGIFIPMEL